MVSLDECKLKPKTKKLLMKMGLLTANDVLETYPVRYDDARLIPLSQWIEKQSVIFEGVVSSKPIVFHLRSKRLMHRFLVQVDHDVVEITMFNRPWLSQLMVNEKVVITGRYEGKNKVIGAQCNKRSLQSQLGLKPIYPLTEGLTQQMMGEVMRQCYSHSEFYDWIPSFLISTYRLLTKKEAMLKIHFPNDDNDVKAATRTLKYEEFLRFFTTIRYKKFDNMVFKQPKVFDIDEVFKVANRLPYALTNDQLSAINDILNDLQSDKVMMRLVQGDVGCGKTLVASLAMLATSLSGNQAALLAPTEILAKQHYESLKKLFRSTDLVIKVLYSSLSSSKKKEIVEQLADGTIDIVVGTHALLQPDIRFKCLGLAVADEQQRFGVAQRHALVEKGDNVDFLLMSATPIPRTLANTIYGDLSVSTIVTMPVGRKQVITIALNSNDIVVIMDAIKQQIADGRQVYVVCSAIEESDDCVTVSEIASLLEKHIDKVGMLHGKMSSEAKEEVMEAFSRNEIAVLVSTTVIEVGVNVANATMMVIMDAHRFGLSQLHQLRGRVQRGSHQGVCYLMSDSEDENSVKRLQVLVNSSDGFEISLQDFRLRGPGDIIGVRQSGLPTLKLGNFIDDVKIMETAKKDAEQFSYEVCKQCLTAFNSDVEQLLIMD